MESPPTPLPDSDSTFAPAPHDHRVQFYEHDGTLIDSVADFGADALLLRGSAIVVATREHLDALEQRWSARGVDAAAARATGRYVPLDAHETLEALLVEGWPDAARFAEVIETRVAACAALSPRIAVFGELVALLWAQGRHDAAVRLEALWNELTCKHCFALLCAYPVAQMKSGPWRAVHGVCGAHSQVLSGAPHTLTSDERHLAEICDLKRRARELEAETAQREAAERELAARERELSDFLENAAQAIHSVGPDGVILWANRCELAMLGYTADEYVGHGIAEFYADANVCADVLRRLAAGEALHEEPVRMRCKDGSVRDVLVTSNVRFKNGVFVQTRCFTRDITNQLRAEHALREVEQRADHVRALYAAIVESSDDAIVSKSLDGCITGWNEGARRLFGYSADEAIGKSITMLIPPELQHEEQHILDKIARGERIDHFETERIAKDGRRIDVSLTISPIRDGAGTVVGASKVARDVSERKRMEAKLREADQRKNEFIAVLGHELRNPLAPIRSIAEVLRRTAAATPGMERFCTILERQVAQMTRLLDDLLDVSRITRGKINFQKERLNLGDLVQRAVEASRPLIDVHRHELRLAVPKGTIVVHGDAVRLVQMVTNLLNNAAKYTPEGGTIELRIARRDEDAEIHVKDNGVGIAPEVLPDVFELFVQGDRDGGRTTEGLGIGLTLVRMIAEHHGGSVSAASEGRDRGSEFVVTLPALREGSRAAPTVLQTPSPPAARKRILIVDDNRDSCEALSTLLRLSGHDVFVAGDGASGVRMAETLRPDLALLDIGLPGMSGYEVAERLRAGGCNVPLAALTGFGTAKDRERSRRAGFDHHFVKPIDPIALERLIGSLP